MDIEYLKLDTVILLHDLLLERDGGLQGVEMTKLEAKLALPMSGFGVYERYPKIEEKAALYLYELATGHCFKDGNKRTSYAATYVFLDINGYDLVAEDEEIVQFVEKVADDKKRPPFEVVVDWIKMHMNKREEEN